MPEWIIAIISVIIGTLLGFALNLWRDELQGKKNKKQDALEKHFDELKQSIIIPIFTIIAGLKKDFGTIEATTLTGNRTMDDPPFPLNFGFEELYEYQGFQVHYPETDKAWRELITNTWKQNQDVNLALKEIEEYINNNPELPPIKEYNPPNEEKIIPQAIAFIFQSIYSLANGQRPFYDFSQLHVGDQSESLKYVSVSSQIVAITSNEKVEKCKAALVELQNSQRFKERAQGLDGNAFNIMMGFKYLANKLNDIYSYGLISSKKEQKFELSDQCQICKNLFHKS